MNKTKETTPIESLPGYTVDDSLDPGMAELTTYIPGQDSPITVRGDAELLREDFQRQVAADAKRPAVKPVQKPVEPAESLPAVELQYVDFSTIPRAEIARMKLKSWFYDRQHKTDMYGRLLERIDGDRDVAFARSLGLVSVTRCAKHEKAVSKLRGLVQ